jgi:hypothetical protein
MWIQITCELNDTPGVVEVRAELGSVEESNAFWRILERDYGVTGYSNPAFIESELSPEELHKEILAKIEAVRKTQKEELRVSLTQ